MREGASRFDVTGPTWIRSARSLFALSFSFSFSSSSSTTLTCRRAISSSLASLALRAARSASNPIVSISAWRAAVASSLAFRSAAAFFSFAVDQGDHGVAVGGGGVDRWEDAPDTPSLCSHPPPRCRRPSSEQLQPPAPHRGTPQRRGDGRSMTQGYQHGTQQCNIPPNANLPPHMFRSIPRRIGE